MATQIQRRRGTTAQHSTFTGALGELTVDTDKKTVVVHDGITAGGHPLAVAAAVASAYAPLASPALTDVPTAPTATAGTNTKQIATTEFVQTSVTGVSTTFASSAENAAGTVEGKAVDPLGIREAFNASGSAPVYACRAWVNFNGTGTVAIRASGNVSSITDNGTGNYTVNFIAPMPDANYSVFGQVRRTADSALAHQLALWASDIKSVSAVQVRSSEGNLGGLVDLPEINVVIIR